jgi:hypothetical protein
MRLEVSSVEGSSIRLIGGTTNWPSLSEFLLERLRKLLPTEGETRANWRSAFSQISKDLLTAKLKKTITFILAHQPKETVQTKTQRWKSPQNEHHPFPCVIAENVSDAVAETGQEKKINRAIFEGGVRSVVTRVAD